jgi:hypothetical protein
LLFRNTILFRCDQEERDANGGGVYVLDGHPLVYAGLQGLMSLLAEIRPINDLGNWYANASRRALSQEPIRRLMNLQLQRCSRS